MTRRPSPWPCESSRTSSAIPPRSAEPCSDQEPPHVQHRTDEKRHRSGDEPSCDPRGHAPKLSLLFLMASVKTNVTELPESRVRVQAEVPADEVERRVQQAARKL